MVKVNRKVLYRFLGVATLGVGLLLVGCQEAGGMTVEALTNNLVPSSTETAAVNPSASPTTTETTTPTQTPIPTKTLTPTPELVIEINPELIKWLLEPCKTQFKPIDTAYPNPQENLDPTSGKTWMAITLEEGFLSDQFNFHYWWDTRAFQGDLSFNVGDGPCEVLLETNQILCKDIPLQGTENLSTGGYEYDFKIYLQDYDCNRGPNYQQVGLIYIDKGEHNVYIINGEAVP